MLKMGWMPAHPTLFLKRGVYDKHGLYDLTFSISADYDFIIRVFKDKSLRIEHLSKVIINMRVGGTSNKNLKNIFIKMKFYIKNFITFVRDIKETTCWPGSLPGYARNFATQKTCEAFLTTLIESPIEMAIKFGFSAKFRAVNGINLNFGCLFAPNGTLEPIKK